MTREYLVGVAWTAARALVWAGVLAAAGWKVYGLGARAGAGTAGEGVVIALQAVLFVLGLVVAAASVLALARARRDEERALLWVVWERSGGRSWSPSD